MVHRDNNPFWPYGGEFEWFEDEYGDGVHDAATISAPGGPQPQCRFVTHATAPEWLVKRWDAGRWAVAKGRDAIVRFSAASPEGDEHLDDRGYVKAKALPAPVAGDVPPSDGNAPPVRSEGGAAPETPWKKREPPRAFYRVQEDGDDWAAWTWWNHKARLLGAYPTQEEAQAACDEVDAILEFDNWPASTPGKDGVVRGADRLWRGYRIRNGVPVRTEGCATEMEARETIRALVEGRDPDSIGAKMIETLVARQTGVSKMADGRFRATILWDEAKRYLKTYDTREEAQAHHDRILRDLVERKWPAKTNMKDGVHRFDEHKYKGLGVISGELFETLFHVNPVYAAEELALARAKARAARIEGANGDLCLRERDLPRNIYWDRTLARYVVKVQAQGERVHVGSYRTREDAEVGLAKWQEANPERKFRKAGKVVPADEAAWSPADIVPEDKGEVKKKKWNPYWKKRSGK